MNLTADESVEKAIVDRLRADGHTVTYIGESSPSISDQSLLDIANNLNTALITSDKDFGELVYRMGRLHSGILLIRLEGLDLLAKAEEVSTSVRNHSNELPNAFAVLSPGMVRIRRQLS